MILWLSSFIQRGNANQSNLVSAHEILRLQAFRLRLHLRQCRDRHQILLKIIARLSRRLHQPDHVRRQGAFVFACLVEIFCVLRVSFVA